MARVDEYREHVKNLLRRYGSYRLREEGVERQLIFDIEGDHYLLFTTGWDKHERVHGCAIHVDIKDGKIWIQDNRTEFDIAQELVALGVPKQDIVLAFHAPDRRPLTGFAVG